MTSNIVILNVLSSEDVMSEMYANAEAKIATSAPVKADGTVAVYIIYSTGQSGFNVLTTIIDEYMNLPIRPINRGSFLKTYY